MQKLSYTKIFLALVAMLTVSSGYSESKLDPRFFYFHQGETVGNWTLQLGDSGDWNMAVKNKTGKSKNGKVSITSEDFQAQDDALRVNWSRKKEKGEFKIAGSNMDIAAAKNVAALTFDLKINKKPSKGVTASIDCNWPCRAEVNIGRQLRKQKTGEWFGFPIPLNCFKSDDFDLSKVNAFMIGTEGKLDLSIAGVRLERLPEGEKGCAED